MTTETAPDIQILRDADLRPRDLAQLVKVNRVTASHWLGGHTKPCRLLWPKLHRVIGAVQRARDAGDLPLPAFTPRADRAERLAAALLPHIERA